MFGHESLTLDEFHVIVVIRDLLGVYRNGNHDSVTLPQICLTSCNKPPNSKIELSVRNRLCMRLNIHSSMQSLKLNLLVIEQIRLSYS